jgi:uncharacterized membrane protein
MFFFAMLFLLFVFMRLARRGHHGFARVQCYHHHYRHRLPQPEQRAPQPTPFERLKQRYVDGDLSDEQYEEELDKLLRGGSTASFDSSSARAGASARLI